MRNQTKYLFVYLCIVCLLVGSVVQLAQAQEQITGQVITESSSEASEAVELDQAQLDQILAPIALYPDTLLSHVLVASTYPLEVIQAARWRAANKDLNEQQALNAAKDKDWDPSIQALVPFNDLLQTLSEDLDWLQSLGSAFLINEQQILTSVQNLRQKAYRQGNLTNNNYVNVEQEEGEIIIETVSRKVIYVPYYDTRIIYGDWWWLNRQPYYWHRPGHSIFNAGLYWSIGYNILPSFYFGGFHWRNRHLVANYHYRNRVNRQWSNSHNRHQMVRVKEYPRWTHNQQHRRGAQHRVNGQRIVRNMDLDKKTRNKIQVHQQFDKKRILNVNRYTINNRKSDAKQFKQALGNQQHAAHQTRSIKKNKLVNNKQQAVNQSKNQQRQQLGNSYGPNKVANADIKQNNKIQRSTGNTQNKISPDKTNNKNSHKSSRHHTSPKNQNKSRPVKVMRKSNAL